jgi:hypothetical protein
MLRLCVLTGTFSLSKGRTGLLLVQVYTPTLEYGDDKVEELYNTTEDVLAKDGKGDTNTITM